jgi:hypothetical protein
MPVDCGVKVKVFDLAHAKGYSSAACLLRELIFLRDLMRYFPETHKINEKSRCCVCPSLRLHMSPPQPLNH